eukprot:m.130432 g.130432  ORF g.130432 m.130432 type:complete len:272 (-) comp13900_c0_seq1:368-1183(-)
MLSRGTPMTSFTLCSCSFGAETRKSQFGDNAMRHLAAALKNNHTLTFLGLRSYFRGTKLTPCSAEDIVEVLNGCTALKTLDLARNSIQDAGVIPVAQALRVNTCLEELDLEDNSIGKGGAQHLAEMLLMNKAIRRLNLHHNCLEEEEGAVQLLESVRRQRGYFVEFGELEMTEIRMDHDARHFLAFKIIYERDATCFATRFRRQAGGVNACLIYIMSGMNPHIIPQNLEDQIQPTHAQSEERKLLRHVWQVRSCARRSLVMELQRAYLNTC